MGVLTRGLNLSSLLCASVVVFAFLLVLLTVNKNEEQLLFSLYEDKYNIKKYFYACSRPFSFFKD